MADATYNYNTFTWDALTSIVVAEIWPNSTGRKQEDDR
jgi:hypothetical protein